MDPRKSPAFVPTAFTKYPDQQLATSASVENAITTHHIASQQAESRRSSQTAPYNPARNNDRTSEVSVSRLLYCFISNCGQYIETPSLLAHFMENHTNTYFDKEEIFAEEKFSIALNVSLLNLNEIHCFGVLLYGGRANNLDARPAELGLMRHNENLSDMHSQYVSHLPVFLFGDRIEVKQPPSNRASFARYSLDSTKNTPNAKPMVKLPFNRQQLVFWLSSIQTKNPIQYTFTATSLDGNVTIKRKILIRKFAEPHDANHFVGNDPNCLLLKTAEVRRLTNNCKDSFNLEITIHERG